VATSEKDHFLSNSRIQRILTVQWVRLKLMVCVEHN